MKRNCFKIKGKYEASCLKEFNTPIKCALSHYEKASY